jgi:uncharacterized membrane protein HdeD (DUF308 family)
VSTATMTAEESTGLSPNEWWILLLQGICSIIIGILLITDPQTTLLTLIVFLGIWWFVAGIFDLVRLFVDRTNWGWSLFSGIIGIIAGLAIIRHPLWASVLVPATLVWIVGFLGIIMGIVSIVRGFQGGGWGPGILGVLSIVFGVLLLGVNILNALPFLVMLTAIVALVGGVVAIVYGFRLRNA